MTLTLEIAPEVEAALKAQARRVGASLPDYAAARLAEVRHTSGTTSNATRPQLRALCSFAGA